MTEGLLLFYFTSVHYLLFVEDFKFMYFSHHKSDAYYISLCILPSALHGKQVLLNQVHC